MPLASFSHQGRARLGKVFGDTLVDLSVAAPNLPTTIIDFLAAGDAAIEAFRAVQQGTNAQIALADVRLLPPIPQPEKFLGIGMNYRDHAAEAVKAGLAAPAFQLWFNKQVSCITGPFDDVVKPDVSEKMDYEAELGVVIGRRCRHVAVEEARSVIGGYLVVNDVSARDWQLRTPTFTLGKSFDTHGPIGPWLTLDHEIADPLALDLHMFVNGEQRQYGNTGSMIHNIYEQIAYLSTVMTLKPGDILATGTPSGVGIAMDPQCFLNVGDVMRVEIDQLGHIENRVIADQGRSA
jgi:2-keto-4-pentenoate hydratase/2-oxohepta-3-ene-1,7-dioic acid hydratase in catechol pathway